MPENNTAPEWSDALCAQTDPDMFTPERGGTTTHARAICDACPLKRSGLCLEYALANNERGIWAGTTDQERARLRNGAATETEIRARIKRAHENGTPALELAAIYGVSVRTVQRWVHGKKEEAA